MDPCQLSETLNVILEFDEKYTNVYFFNLIEDTIYHTADFHDVNHLNETGAWKLSTYLNQVINEIDRLP